MTLRPTRKPNGNWTHHNDGTVSFLNTLTGQWERGDSKQYLADLRAARAAKQGA